MRSADPAVGCLALLLVVMLAQAFTGCARYEYQFDGQRAYQHVLRQCEFGPRPVGSEAGRRTAEYIVSELDQLAWTTESQEFAYRGIIGRNIIASKGSGPVVILGAHYDTRSVADRDPVDPTVPVLGANDGASGVAVLLEISRLLGQNKPPIGVDVVFFDGEDYGEEGVLQDYILGSTYFADNLKGYHPHSVIIVDMIGDRDLTVRYEGFSRAASSELLEELFSIAERLQIEAFKREAGATLIDDHLPFIQRNISAVVLVDFDYPFWHTLEDTPDKCSVESLDAVGEVLVEFIWIKR